MPEDDDRGTLDRARTGKWKPKLLASGLPLEHQVAQLLTESGFHVTSDFTFHRSTAGHDVEWSVDIRATRQTAHVPGADRGCAVDLLLDCKQRTRVSAWLFLPDLRTEWMPEFEVLRGVEDFTPWSLTDTKWWTSPIKLPLCYKGTEIDLTSGHVESAELRHGFSQLQLAIPPLLRSRIGLPMTTFGIDTNTPFFFSTILVTNADLIVARRDLTPAHVEDSNALLDLGQKVDALVTTIPAGQDFFQHVRKHFAGISEIVQRKGIRSAEEHRRNQGVHPSELPSALAERLTASGEEIEALTNVTNIVVCRIGYLKNLITQLVLIADRVAESAALDRPAHFRF